MSYPTRRYGNVVIFLICVFEFYFMGAAIRNSEAKRRSAPIRTNDHADHPPTAKNKKIRTNPQLPGHRGKAPIRIRVLKKSTPIQKNILDFI
ncbi:MAG: hypothetical protein HDS25_01250 [Bacteroides sp.]|nr:hypothetical protein [Bacteroides sp.]